ncbi:MAG: histone deacetylase [Chthoniobacterales bacterium]
MLFVDPVFKQHRTAPGHPESPARIDALIAAFEVAGLTTAFDQTEPREATLDELFRAHESTYVESVLARIESGVESLAGGDVSVGPASGQIARLATGTVLAATDAVCTGSTQTAFCATRPPGHHASADRPMGFCIFNHVAVAARHAQAVHGLERIAILDWDVHHGNGSQDIFYEDSSVFFASTHQSPWYPGTGTRDETGRGPGLGTTFNRPLPARSGRRDIFDAFQRDIFPAVREFGPDLIIISAGFDSRIGDPLGDFTLTDHDFADLTALVRETAAEVCNGRIVSVLEGGYSLPGLASAATAHSVALFR